MGRRMIIAGNWKMNMTPKQAVDLINRLKPLVKTEDADVVFCVPAIDIIPAAPQPITATLFILQNPYSMISRSPDSALRPGHNRH